MEKFLINLVKEAKQIFVKKHRFIKHKSANDLLSEADLELNDFLVSSIKNEYPKAKIIAEESENSDLTNDLTFVIDPLDGTCNYSLNIKMCGIQLAVLKDKEMILSIIYLPYQNKLFFAKKDGGVFLNGKKLILNNKVNHNDGVLILSDFYDVDDDINLDNQYKLVKDLRLDFLKTRLFGAACVDFSFLISSKAQAYICYYRNLWDILPGLLMVQELGMVYSRIDGEPYVYNGHSLVVANNLETFQLIVKKASKYLTKI